MTPSSPTSITSRPGAPGFSPSRGHRSRPGVASSRSAAPIATARVSGTSRGIYSDLLLHDMGPDLTSVTMDHLLRPARWSISRQRPAWPMGQSGGRRHCGDTATRARISTMAGPRISRKP